MSDETKCHFEGTTGRDGTKKCRFNGKPEDYLCWGCKVIVCENHELADFPPMGSHSPIDHRKESA